MKHHPYYGKVASVYFGGVDLTLICIDYPVDKDHIARMIDRTGTYYDVLKDRITPTGETLAVEEVERIESLKGGEKRAG